METEIIDKLFLELGQITQAKTQKEIQLETALEKARTACVAASAWFQSADRPEGAEKSIMTALNEATTP